MKKILLYFLSIMFMSCFSSVILAEEKQVSGLVSNDIDILNEEQIESKEEQLDNTNLADTIEEFLPTVVTISAIKNNNYDDEYYENNTDNSKSMGSGFIISEDGFIITNNHIIDNSDKINIKLKGSETEFPAEIIGVDEIMDIALLKLNLKIKLPFVTFNENKNQRIGDLILVAGNPYNLGTSVSTGIISGLNKNLGITTFDNFIQTDASINKGNSGGPMFNTSGKVIGLTSAIYSPNGANVGIGFAIPSTDLLPIIEELKKYGYVRRGWIGITTLNARRDVFSALNSQLKNGVIITKIAKDSPADKSGLKVSDVILSYNGKKIKNSRDLSMLISSTEIGRDADFKVFRKGKIINFSVKVEESKENYEYDEEYEKIISKSIEIFDMFLVPITKEAKKRFNIKEDKGMYVLKVKKDGFANKKGIKTGDIIISINQDVIIDENTIFENIQKAKLNRTGHVFLITSKNDLIFIPTEENSF